MEETLVLPCKLTKDELLDYSKSLVKLVTEKSQLEEEKKDEAKKFKEEIDAKDYAIKRISGIISSETIERDVPCVWNIDHEAKTKTLIRTDTGELVRTLPLTVADMQKPLHLVTEAANS